MSKQVIKGLIESAVEHVKKAAFLDIDKEADRLVDKIVNDIESDMETIAIEVEE